MTINLADNTPRIEYSVAQGVTQTTFAVPFEFFDNADLTVYVDGVEKTEGSDYTVTGGDGSTGQITMSVTGGTGGSTVVLVRDIAIERTTDFTSNAINRAALNTQLDTIIGMIADLDDKASRTLQISDYEVAPDLSLPSVDARKGATLAFNESTGAVEVGPTIAATNTVANIAADISAVAANNADVSTVATNIVGVSGIAANLDEILLADDSAAAAAASATASANSATASSGYASASSGYADAALLSMNTAIAAKNAAETAETNAAASATAAASSEAGVAADTLAATNAASAAAASQTSAAASAATATTKASEAEGFRNDSATNAATSSAAATNAQLSATAAASSATAAASSASLADSEAANADASATEAATFATNAATSATSAASSATAAASSATAAAASEAAALAALDEFTDIYLGAKASDPATDNDGNALTVGDQYFNTTTNVLKIYNGSTWQSAALDSTGFVETAGDTMTGNLSFGDNNKAIFGAGSDLQIYHDGGNSFIDDVGTGRLYIRASDGIHLANPSNALYLSTYDTGNLVLYYNGAAKLATTSTGVDVTGTVTADGLTVDGNPIVRGTIPYIYLYETDTTNLNTGLRGADGQFQIRTVDDVLSTTVKRFSLDHATGDISFYEDTGTTPKLFWDASTERLGIGTSSLDATLTVEAPQGLISVKSTSGSKRVALGSDAFTDAFVGTTTAHNLSVITGGSIRAVFDASGNVGIGTSGPAYKLHVAGDVFTSLGSSFFSYTSDYGVGTPDSGGFQIFTGGGDTIRLGHRTSGTFTERLRIDASGNVLVGTTNSTPGVGDTDTGCSISGGGFLFASRNAGSAGYFNRNTSDGPLVSFYKEGAGVGSIGTITSGSTDAYYAGPSTGLRFRGDGMLPVNQVGDYKDNIKDLGSSGVRFDDIFATNGTIQTSDANEKQQIAELTAAEMQAAKAISKLFKTFKWNDSVAEKGDDARIHTGVIAQEVEAAMTDAGLDAGRYAFFISTTWWESTEVIPAVEEVLDEEGSVVTEAQAERTVTHTHETAEEAPEGAVERNRKGIRYPQLLSFIGAATEQRLASIEARLDAANI